MNRVQQRFSNSAILTAVLILALAFLCLPAAAGAAENDEISEWTVLIYLCGSDLESAHGYATETLEDILECQLPFDMYSLYMMDQLGLDADWNPMYQGHDVNVLVETGGSRTWQAKTIGMDIQSDLLQRWRFTPLLINPDTQLYENRFRLEDEQPLACMADPGTLADFIRWGTALCPARKYALVLWDHGEGSRGGLFIDDFFPDERMYLDELGQALKDGGAFFEAVLLDACMMANVETGSAIRENARWMIASEENVAGQGTAIGDWIGQLYRNPEADGEWLGRWICDMTEIRNTEEFDERVSALMTWSVTDLAEIDDVAGAVDRYFAAMTDLYVRNPELLCTYLRYALDLESFGDFGYMRDIAGLVYDLRSRDVMQSAVQKDLLSSLNRAVQYVTRGTGRSRSRGLSICYALGLESAELEIYARNCPFPHFLALLDAFNSDWEAPAWVYEHTGRLSEMADSRELYKISVTRRMTTDGIPGLIVNSASTSVFGVFYRLYRLDEETEQVVRLGEFPTSMDFSVDYQIIECPGNPMIHPAIGGNYCDVEVVDYDRAYGTYQAKVPVQINSKVWDLRIGYDDKKGFEAYGLWDDYEDSGKAFSRNVKALVQFAGQQFRLLYPLDGTENQRNRQYEFSEDMPLTRYVGIESKPLPPGTYYLEYEIRDVFGHRHKLDRIEYAWDGERMIFPEGFSWEGTISGI